MTGVGVPVQLVQFQWHWQAKDGDHDAECMWGACGGHVGGMWGACGGHVGGMWGPHVGGLITVGIDQMGCATCSQQSIDLYRKMSALVHLTARAVTGCSQPAVVGQFEHSDQLATNSDHATCSTSVYEQRQAKLGPIHLRIEDNSQLMLPCSLCYWHHRLSFTSS
jgi:hypothetical protein